MKYRISLTVLLILVFVLNGQSAQHNLSIDTSPYEKYLNTVTKNEKLSSESRELAGQIVTGLKEKNYPRAVNRLERLVRLERDTSVAYQSRLMICELALKTLLDLNLAALQFRSFSNENKEKAIEHWMKKTSFFTKEKHPARKRLLVQFLNQAANWAERRRSSQAEKIRFFIASLVKDDSKKSASVYEQVARTSRNGSERSRALYELAKSHLKSDRFSDALDSLRQISEGEWLKRRFEMAIQVCLQTPDSFAAIAELKREKRLCRFRQLRSRFDVAIAGIYLREEKYGEAESFLLTADAQYSYADVMEDLKKRMESEKKRKKKLQERIWKRLKELAQGVKPK